MGERMSIYDEIRALASIDLTRNEMKVWLVYRAEMDEGCRQVRGKTAEMLRSKTDLGRAQFAAASAGLQAKGIIETRRQRNAAQVILVPELTLGTPENPDIREIKTSGKPGCPGNPVPGSPGFPDAGSPGFPDHDIYAAPVSTPESAPSQRAMREDGMPAHVKPISNWNLAFAQPEPGIEFDGGRVRLVNGTRAEWLERFGGDAEALDLALIEVSGKFQPNSRSHSPRMQVERELARIVREDRNKDKRYQQAVQANAKQRGSSQSSAPSDKPTVSELLRRRREEEAAAA